MTALIDRPYFKARPSKAIVRILSHFMFQGRFLTTKYRWLNRFVLAELACLKRFPQLKPVEKPIFIVGTGRSGTTILGKVLSMHRDIGFLNEPKAVWYTVCPKEDVNGHFNRGPALYRFSAQDITPQIRQVMHRLFGAYLAITRSKRVLDKNPEVVFRIPFTRAIFPDAKFIFLVRNGWDTIFSIAEWSKRNCKHVRGETEDWWGVNRRKWQLMVEQLVPTEPLLSQAYKEIKAFTQQEDMAAVEWIVTMREGLRLMESIPNCMHLVPFEDLTRQPERTLRALLEFCELPNDPVFFSYARKVLKPVPHRQPLGLSLSVQAPFLETMRALNYPVAEAL